MFGRRKKEDWWQHSNQEQNAEMAQAASSEAAPADTVPDGDEATQPAEEQGRKKAKKKSRWDWWDAAGDVLEVIIDFVTELFD